jgi:hypothetical protein
MSFIGIALPRLLQALLGAAQGDAAINRSGFKDDVEALSVLVLKGTANSVEIALAVIRFVDVIGNVAGPGLFWRLRRLLFQRRRGLRALFLTHGIVSCLIVKMPSSNDSQKNVLRADLGQDPSALSL